MRRAASLGRRWYPPGEQSSPRRSTSRRPPSRARKGCLVGLEDPVEIGSGFGSRAQSRIRSRPCPRPFTYTNPRRSRESRMAEGGRRPPGARGRGTPNSGARPIGLGSLPSRPRSRRGFGEISACLGHGDFFARRSTPASVRLVPACPRLSPSARHDALSSVRRAPQIRERSLAPRPARPTSEPAGREIT
jgi:hypothetical protein